MDRRIEMRSTVLRGGVTLRRIEIAFFGRSELFHGQFESARRRPVNRRFIERMRQVDPIGRRFNGL